MNASHHIWINECITESQILRLHDIDIKHFKRIMQYLSQKVSLGIFLSLASHHGGLIRQVWLVLQIEIIKWYAL